MLVKMQMKTSWEEQRRAWSLLTTETIKFTIIVKRLKAAWSREKHFFPPVMLMLALAVTSPAVII